MSKKSKNSKNAAKPKGRTIYGIIGLGRFGHALATELAESRLLRGGGFPRLLHRNRNRDLAIDFVDKKDVTPRSDLRLK